MPSNPSDTNARAQRTAAQEEQRIQAIVDRRIRETFKNGMPSGTYGSYQWDGMKIVGGTAGGGALTARFFDTAITGAAITNLSTVEYIYSREAGTGSSWFDASTPVRIIVPVTGVFETIVLPQWITDNQTGDRALQIDQARGGVGWDSASWAWPCRHTNAYVSMYPSLVNRWDVVAGDEFRMYVSHNGGVNTLKCRLDCWFQQLG